MKSHLLFVAALWASPALADSLALTDFLAQVGRGNAGVQSGELSSQGGGLRADEGAELLAPTLFGSAQLASDAKIPQIPVFTYDRVVSNTYQLGISELTSFGLQGKLYYRIQYTSFVNPIIPGGQSPSAAGFPLSFYDASPVLELTQSLWSNGFGRSTRANQELLEAQALAGSYSARFQARSLLADAESAYWRLSAARQAIQIQKDALERARKIRDYMEKRARLSLVDRADALQAQAALDLKQLDLQSATDEERSAALAFNDARGVSSPSVPERLEVPTPELIASAPIPTREKLRDDVKAAEQQSRASQANSVIARERNAPVLEVFGSYALNGRDTGFLSSVENPYSANRPTEAIGVRFQVPLDLATLDHARQGWRLEERAADFNFQKKAFDQEQNWDDLVHRFGEAKKRIGLAQAIERAQLVKLEHERTRLTRGRTTTYQVLLFEQDYDLAQLNRVRIQAEALTLLAQMKLYTRGATQ